MKRFNIYLDRNENLIFSTMTDNNLSHTLSMNYQVFHNIDNLLRCKISNIVYENQNLILEYNQFSLCIQDFQKVFRRKEVLGLVQDIKKYKEKEQLQSVKKRKVTRKNKYSKRKILVGGLALSLIIASSSYLMDVRAQSNNEINYYINNSEHIVVEHSTTNYNNMNFDDEVMTLENYKNSNIVLEQNTSNEIKSESKIYIDYENRSETEKAAITKSYYGDLIEKYSKMYGLDSNLVTAIATQERGIHSEIMDRGGATGLMQIQNSVWENRELTAYNYETNSKETIIVDIEKISNIDYNIKVGCMILQNNLEYMNYNAFAAIQSYNMGYGNMQKILNKYSNESGKSIDEILNSNDLGWLEYRNIISVGDPIYLENVLSWMGSDIIINNYSNGTIISTCVTCNEITKTI